MWAIAPSRPNFWDQGVAYTVSPPLPAVSNGDSGTFRLFSWQWAWQSLIQVSQYVYIYLSLFVCVYLVMFCLPICAHAASMKFNEMSVCSPIHHITYTYVCVTHRVLSPCFPCFLLKDFYLGTAFMHLTLIYVFIHIYICVYIYICRRFVIFALLQFLHFSWYVWFFDVSVCEKSSNRPFRFLQLLRRQRYTFHGCHLPWTSRLTQELWPKIVNGPWLRQRQLFGKLCFGRLMGAVWLSHGWVGMGKANALPESKNLSSALLRSRQQQSPPLVATDSIKYP